jgi:hypothetical protein
MRDGMVRAIIPGEETEELFGNYECWKSTRCLVLGDKVADRV